MSHTALIPSHRKPRQSASKTALRAGVAGGVLSTIAVAGAAGPAQAEPVTQTIEMPTITAGLSTTVAASAEATQQVALDLETQANEDAAAATAAKAAKKAKAEAVRKAEAKKKAEAAAKAKAEAKAEAAERASRSAERTTLSAPSGSSSSGSSVSTASAPASSSASGSAASVVSFVQMQVGDAYVSGGTGPNSWDCSGLVQAAFRTVGVDLPRVSQSQSTAGTQVGLGNLQPGDILYWGGAGSAYHVGVYVGGGQFVGAQNSSTGVVQKSLDYDPPSGAVRVL
ncbi:C40 family peptidase [Streptomyces sp. NPDC049967]|uniref:C40 family peptidase n=1 Tax=unclassified Streptomyces TaxID=2593676 RepID=UPI000939DD54|nr:MULTISPECIES: C40 family peptidase [unclassified Streptomyces]OKK24961.1 glycoside hydrolase [Streptomyces sp. CB02488]WRZ13590.1 C40 family peptidase [Streptomyces sp. NBC_00341]WSJ24531.1 C40 family peptidase [Streptomyces sp. NBC_01324]